VLFSTTWWRALKGPLPQLPQNIRKPNDLHPKALDPNQTDQLARSHSSRIGSSPSQLFLIDAQVIAGKVQPLRGFVPRARPYVARTVKIWEISLGPGHPQVKSVMEDYAGILRRLGDEEEAQRVEARIAAIQSTTGPE